MSLRSASLRPRQTVDPDRWPDVAAVPRCSAARVAIARALGRRAFGRMPLRVRLGDQELPGGDGPLLEVRDPDAFYRRIATGGLIGFGESYMAGEWDAEDLVGVLTVLAGNLTNLVPRLLQRLRPLWAPRRPATQRASIRNAPEQIRHHYDLSNEMFALFLDETMTYSSAVFAGLPATDDELADAQRRKIDRILDGAGVGQGTRVLEIGTGWGELALCAARRGAEVVSITLSEQQRDLALERIREAGLAERVTIMACDYREVTGSYDAVVSVEMIEAVGERYWPVYFSTLAHRLAPGGTVGLQAITTPHERLVATRNTFTWIQKYIFPGGLVPSLVAIEREAERAGLRVIDRQSFEPHYAETLRLWRGRFTDRAADVEALGFDETFRRMWTLYLAYSEAGFRTGNLDVYQILLKEQQS
jgi:cyclopropane-fatty-acyl-phospholipid synthase